MSITDQFSQWVEKKTLLRITTVEKGKGHQIHVGNMLFIDEQGMNIFFYDLDQKKNYNLSMNEIEEIQPYDKNKKQETAKAKKDEKNLDLSKKLIAIDEKFKEEIRENMREEVISLIKKLPSKELYALLPLLQLLVNKQER